jgi:hypothetical protein
MSKNSQQLPEPSPALRHRDIFIGKWNTEGESKTNQYGPAVKISAVDTYEWLDGEFFLVHRWDACISGDETRGIEIIGYDNSNQMYFTHSFDNKGNSVTYQASLNDGVWKILGESERFTGRFSPDGNILVGKWEILSDGKWLPWMDVKLTKIR